MKISYSPFWDQIKSLARLDDSVDVPAESVRAAQAIFQSRRSEVKLKRFALVPSFVGSVRRTEQTQKFLYKMDNQYMVHLEASPENTGFRLSGSVHGLSDCSVMLYGEEFVSETQIEDGQLEFSSLPSGTYALLLSNDGDDYWVTDITLGDNNRL